MKNKTYFFILVLICNVLLPVAIAFADHIRINAPLIKTFIEAFLHSTFWTAIFIYLPMIQKYHKNKKP